MELRHLRYFMVVAEEENFHRAAERLFIAPSALSRQISDLEEELGFKLFDRIRRRIRLSEAGEIYRARVKTVLGDLDAAGRIAKHAASARAQTLAIGFFPIPISRDIIARSVRWLRAARPEINLTLTPLTPVPLLNALRDGTIDGAFLSNPPECEFARLKLMSHGFRLGVPDFHPLAERKSVRLRELADYPFIWAARSVSPYFDDQLLAACAAKGLRPQIQHELPNADLCLSYVAAGLGITVVGDFTEVGKDIQTVAIDDLDMQTTMYFLWRESRANEPLCQFIAGLRERYDPSPRLTDMPNVAPPV